MIHITPIAAQRNWPIDRSDWAIVTVWDVRSATESGRVQR
jgi:hypothetical protein